MIKLLPLNILEKWLYVGLPCALFSPKSKNSKKPTLKKFLIFAQKKVFLRFWKTEIFGPKIKICLIFNFSEKAFLIPRKMEPFTPKLKKFLIFQEETSKSRKTNKKNRF